jgi:hypothetical protein
MLEGCVVGACRRPALANMHRRCNAQTAHKVRSTISISQPAALKALLPFAPAGSWLLHAPACPRGIAPAATVHSCPHPSPAAGMGPNSEAMRLLEAKMEAVRTALAAAVKLLLAELSQDAAVTAALAAAPDLAAGDMGRLAQEAACEAGSSAEGALQGLAGVLLRVFQCSAACCQRNCRSLARTHG